MARARLHRAGALVLTIALTGIAAACSKSADEATTATTTTSPVVQSNGPGCRFIVAGTGKRFRTADPQDTLEFLQDATAAPTACYDEITFVFDKGDGPDLPPGYTIEYRKAPFGLPGVPTSTAGFKDAKAVIYVELKPTSTKDTRLPGRSITTYKGNLRLALKGMRHTVIVEYVDKVDTPDPTPTDPSDNRLVWLIGLDTKRPFTVDAANQPPRVRVLVMH